MLPSDLLNQRRFDRDAEALIGFQPRSPKVPITLSFTTRAFETMQALANRERISISELLARAIQAESFMQTQREAKRKVLVETKEGQLLEIKI